MKTLTPLVGALALGLLLPTAALAQPIATEVVKQGNNWPGSRVTLAAETRVLVLRNLADAEAAELVSSGLVQRSWLQAFDFQKESLLLGLSSLTGGRAKLAFEVNLRSGAADSGFSPGAFPWIEAKLTRTIPHPSSITTTVMSRPYLLVRMTRPSAFDPIFPRIETVIDTPVGLPVPTPAPGPFPAFEITEAGTQVPSSVTAGEVLELVVSGTHSSRGIMRNISTKFVPLAVPGTWRLDVNAMGNLSHAPGSIEQRFFRRTVKVTAPADAARIRVVFNSRLEQAKQFDRRVTVTPLGSSRRIAAPSQARGKVVLSRLGRHAIVWLQEGNQRTRILPDLFARQLIKFEGLEVVVSGEGLGSDRFQAQTLLEPVQRELEGIALRDGAGVSLVVAPRLPSRLIYTVLETPRSTYSLIEQALRKSVKVRAWVFKREAPLQRPRAMLIGVYATVSKSSDLIRRGQIMNRVEEGQTVYATQLTGSGGNAVVMPVSRTGSGLAGYMPLANLTFGEGPRRPSVGLSARVGGTAE